MKLSATAVAITSALLWGGCLLTIGIADLLVPSYGGSFLHGMSSVYPGFHAAGNMRGVLVDSGEGLLDGMVGGALFALVYNAALVSPLLRH